MKKRVDRRAVTGAVSLAIAVLVSTVAHAEDWMWTNADGDNDYMNGNNWTTNGVVAGAPPTQVGTVKDDVAYINSNGTARCIVVDGQTAPNINEFRIGYNAYGEFEQTGGSVTATSHSSRYTKIGYNGADGLYTLSGGSASFNALRIGAGGGTGTMVINGGGLNIARTISGTSIIVDAGSPAILEISAGSLKTRGGLVMNDEGTFTVKGAGAVAIGIGSSGSGDGFWDQRAGGTLDVQISSGGVTEILVDDVDGIPGTSWDGIATFAADSELDVSFLGGYEETNAWTIMTAEGGIVDNGLKFADSVDTNDWNFEVVNGDTMLVVGYGGATYVPPDYTTNVYVEAVVAMPETWNLFAPEGGDTALSNQSSSGFIATIDTVVESDYRPAVAQEFTSDRDISQVGQAVTVNFDVELLDPTVDLDTGFRFALYDTNTNYQMTLGMLDAGTPSGSTMRMRFDPAVSQSDTNTFAFVPGDYSHLCGGGGTLTSATGYPGNGLKDGEGVIHIEGSVTRTETNELEIVTTWSSGTNAVSLVLSFNESDPANADDVPPGGKWTRLSGFGIKLYSSAPFAAGVGSYEVSNFELSYTASLQEGFGYNVSDITVESSGDVTLTLSNPIVGATYTVLASSVLILDTPTEIGSYVAVAPGIINIPAVDAAPYTPNGFFDVELPVTVVIE